MVRRVVAHFPSSAATQIVHLKMRGICDAAAAKNLELTEQYCAISHLDFAFVPFDPADYSRGYLAALFAFFPYFCGIFLIGYALSSRSRALAFVIAGFLVNEAVNKVLKSAFKQPRPAGAALSNYGLPSSHSQFVAYLAACHFMLMKKTVSKRLWDAMFIVLVALLGVMMWSRVHLGFHTLMQTVVGAATGAAVAVAWILFVNRCHAAQHSLGWCFELALKAADYLSR
jgi:dolichyldiphosphatase